MGRAGQLQSGSEHGRVGSELPAPKPDGVGGTWMLEGGSSWTCGEGMLSWG